MKKLLTEATPVASCQRHGRHTCIVTILVAGLFWLPVHVRGQQRSAVSDGGMVVSVEEHASKAGAAILEKGGNAIDAAVATAFALAVTYPQAGNIGGGGFMLVRLASGETAAIDYREKAPAKAHARMFQTSDGAVDTIASEVGYLVAGVPGTIRGLETAWKRYGKLSWKELLEPAIELAEKGFPLPAFQVLQFKRYRGELSRFPESRKTFFRQNGDAYQTGERFVQKELAATLRTVADSGADVFYKGHLAQRIVADFEAHGGIMTMDDLGAYEAVIRAPVRGVYRGYEILSMPPPSSGGVALIEMLNVLSSFDLSKPDATRTQHVMIETMRRAFFDRARYLGDMDYVAVPVDSLTSSAYAAHVAKGIDIEKAGSSASMGRSASSEQEHMETTHLSVADRDGNVVANTFTLEDNFGSKAVVTGLGFLLNNELHDFTINPDEPIYKGWKGIHPNRIEPGKRPLSSMTPTIVLKDGKPFLITGSPGGKTIINTVLQTVIGVIDYQLSLREVLNRPRLNHTWLPDRVLVEKNRWPGAVVDGLRRLGHVVEDVEYLGDAHSIWIDPVTGRRHGEADFRRMGWAQGVKN